MSIVWDVVDLSWGTGVASEIDRFMHCLHSVDVIDLVWRMYIALKLVDLLDIWFVLIDLTYLRAFALQVEMMDVLGIVTV
jgi:hypothetical protein